MSMILDVLIIATLLICAILYTKRGFIKGILGLCGCLVALIAAAITRPLLQPILMEPLHKLFTGSHGTLSNVLETVLSVETIASMIAFTLLFILFMIVVKLVTFLLDRFCRLPVLKQANRVLGLLLGLVIGLIYAQILSIILFTFAELLVSSQSWITAEAFEGSVVARWMFDHNIFRLFMKTL